MKEPAKGAKVEAGFKDLTDYQESPEMLVGVVVNLIDIVDLSDDAGCDGEAGRTRREFNGDVLVVSLAEMTLERGFDVTRLCNSKCFARHILQQPSE
jgi:hypothetical protein